jgi:uncharacterized membrane protein
MFEVIPNWHPIFVHFTVALLSLAVVLFVVTPFTKPPLQEQWRVVARWTLWFGAGFMVLTGLSGLYAYNTIAHDAPSHIAMTEHRNWALTTIAVFLVLTVWSVLRVRRNQVVGGVFIAAMVIAGGLLAATAWHGGELVYRYGLGVKSLPKAEGEGHHHHDHGDDDHNHISETPAAGGAMDMATPQQEQDPGHDTDLSAAAGTSPEEHHHDDDHDHEHVHEHDH